MIEHCVLNKFRRNLNTVKWQFGYKKNLGTETAVFALKNVVNHYLTNGSTVFSCFLDANKAFDCVLHEKLCIKLLDRKFPVHLVKIMVQKSEI